MTNDFCFSIRKVAAIYSVFIHLPAKLRDTLPNEANKLVLEEIAASGTWGWFPTAIFLKAPRFHSVTLGWIYIRIGCFVLTRRDDSTPGEYYFPSTSWSHVLVTPWVYVSGLSYKQWAQVSGDRLASHKAFLCLKGLLCCPPGCVCSWFTGLGPFFNKTVPER